MISLNIGILMGRKEPTKPIMIISNWKKTRYSPWSVALCAQRWPKSPFIHSYTIVAWDMVWDVEFVFSSDLLKGVRSPLYGQRYISLPRKHHDDYIDHDNLGTTIEPEMYIEWSIALFCWVRNVGVCVYRDYIGDHVNGKGLFPVFLY